MELESVEPQEVNANIKYVTTPDSAKPPDDGKNKEYLNFFDILNKNTIRVMLDVHITIQYKMVHYRIRYYTNMPCQWG